jgi:hypothetical protein
MKKKRPNFPGLQIPLAVSVYIHAFLTVNEISVPKYELHNFITALKMDTALTYTVGEFPTFAFGELLLHLP